MAFDIQIAHSVKEIGREAWEYLGGGHSFSSYRWYRFGEKVLTSDTPVYIVLSQGGEPVARATFWLKRREPLPIPSYIIRHLMQAVLQRRPLMMCQTSLASASGLTLPDPPLRDAALTTIAQVARESARKNRASFLLFSYLEQDETRWAGWPAALNAVTVPDPGTRLVITWPDFEGYLQHLSKSARKDYRRHRNRAADLGIVIKTHKTVTNLDEAMVLIRNVERHHGTPPNPWARTVLENVNMADFTWLTAEMDDRLVGCGLLLGDGDTRFLAFLGLDYTVQYAYFQLVYAAIRCAIEEGIHVLRGGGGAYELKRRLGFQMESNNYGVFAGTGLWFQRVGSWVVNLAANREETNNGA
jgi:predicted N-acyltransferase